MATASHKAVVSVKGNSARIVALRAGGNHPGFIADTEPSSSCLRVALGSAQGASVFRRLQLANAGAESG